MLEILRWVTLVILWGCIALNVWTIVRGLRLNKRLEAERKYCLTMIEACTEFLNAELEDENGRICENRSDSR